MYLLELMGLFIGRVDVIAEKEAKVPTGRIGLGR
jgi:hypothetical protein